MASAQIRVKENGHSGEVHLDEEVHKRLSEYLNDAVLSAEIAAQAGVPESCSVRFTGLLFQPLPLSPSMKKGEFCL